MTKQIQDKVPRKARTPRVTKLADIPDGHVIPVESEPTVLATDSVQQTRVELYGDLVVNFLHADGLQDTAEGEVALRRRTGVAHRRALIVLDELEKLNG